MSPETEHKIRFMMTYAKIIIAFILMIPPTILHISNYLYTIY